MRTYNNDAWDKDKDLMQWDCSVEPSSDVEKQIPSLFDIHVILKCKYGVFERGYMYNTAVISRNAIIFVGVLELRLEAMEHTQRLLWEVSLRRTCCYYVPLRQTNMPKIFLIKCSR